MLLAGPPWCKSREEIGRLDLGWVNNVLMHPRDPKTGQPQWGFADQECDSMESLRQQYDALGVDPAEAEEAERLWNESLAAQQAQTPSAGGD